MDTVVIQIGSRYFVGFGKGGRVKTAWHLAGAQFFIWDRLKQDYEQIAEKLDKKNIGFWIRTIQIVGGE